MAVGGSEIGIIGAGIGGLAAAVALARRGARVTVFETAPALGEVGAGLQISPNGVAVLEALGLGREAADRASCPAALEIRDHRGDRLVACLTLGDTAIARWGRPYWQFHRADLLALLAGNASEAGVTLCTGAAATISGDDMAPRIAAGGTESRFDLVIAADGVRSQTRATRFGGVAPRFTGNVAWRGLVPAIGAVPPVTTLRMGPGRHLITYPLREGRLINFVAVEERRDWADEGWTRPDDPAALIRAFSGWDGPAADLLRRVERTFLWGLFDHPPLARWCGGRVALLGDACHPMLPFFAQGATMALEDAWVLAAELDAAASPEAGLAAYAARRQPRATRVQAAAASNGRIYHLGPGLREPAQLGLAAVSRLAPALLLRRFDWLFGADVTLDTPPGAPLARRAP